MKITPAGIGKYLQILVEVPGRISTLAAHIDEASLSRKPEKSAWSANDILAHLRSCADVWGGSIRSMLTQDDPALPDVHPRQWLKRTNYPQLGFQASLMAYAAQRRELVDALNGLSQEDWSRGALIAGRRHTVFSQVRRLGKHEIEHCEQMENLLK